jgi:hypothetical protein
VRTHRIVATALVCATLGLGLGLGAGVAAAADPPTTVTPPASPATPVRPGAAKCARIEDRVAEIPGIQQRIHDRIDALEQAIADVVRPGRRARVAARLQPRIDKLEVLSRRLDAQVALAERLCGRVT